MRGIVVTVESRWLMKCVIACPVGQSGIEPAQYFPAESESGAQKPFTGPPKQFSLDPLSTALHHHPNRLVI